LNIDKAVLVFAGAVVVTGVTLSVLVSPYWLLLPALAGLNMFQAGITGFCPAAIIFRRIGLERGAAFAGRDARPLA